jgi:hypothetical protein
LIIDVYYDHLHRIAYLTDIFYAGHVSARQFTDMHQSIAARQNFYESTKVANAADGSIVYLADLSGRGTGFHATHRGLSSIRVDCGHNDSSIIIHINGGSRLFLDGADVLSARTNQQADLVRIDRGAKQSRRVST